MTGASFNRGSSRQDYETPTEFVRQVEEYLGLSFAWDLAALAATAKASRYIAPRGSGHEHEDYFSDLTLSAVRGACWLNPPFGDLPRWAARTAEVYHPTERVIVWLSPAAVSTNWFADSVWPHASVVAFRPRLSFVGESHGFPKDLMLAIYGTSRLPKFSLWRYK